MKRLLFSPVLLLLLAGCQPSKTEKYNQRYKEKCEPITLADIQKEIPLFVENKSPSKSLISNSFKSPLDEIFNGTPVLTHEKRKELLLENLKLKKENCGLEIEIELNGS